MDTVLLQVYSPLYHKSREQLSGGSGIGRHLQRGTGRIADGIFGYSTVAW